MNLHEDGYVAAELRSDAGGPAVLRNDRFELTVFRRPAAGPRPPIGLTATWEGLAEPVVLAEVQEREDAPIKG